MDVERELVEGEPRRVLVDTARDADLLVVGSHGHRLVVQAMAAATAGLAGMGAGMWIIVDRGACALRNRLARFR